MATRLTLPDLVAKIKLDKREFDQGIDQSQGKSRQFGATLRTAVGGAAVAAFAVATKAAVDFARDSMREYRVFEQGIREVYTLLPGMSDAAMSQMRDDVLRFGAAVGRTTDETLPALYQAISAGVPPENVFDFLGTASDAALGGVTDLETAVDGITSVVNAYGLEILTAAEASDLMFTAVKGGKTDFEQLSRSIFQVTPIASSLGVEFGTLTAAVATLTAQGVPTSVAMTQIRQMLVELSREGGKASRMFQELSGQSFREFIASGGNVQQALQIMEQGAADLNVGLNDMFSSVEAGGAALGLTGSATEKFTSELEAAENSAGATAEAAEMMGGSIQQLERRIEATTQALMVHSGEGLEPAMRGWLEFKLMLAEDVLPVLVDVANSVGDGLRFVAGGVQRDTADMVDALADGVQSLDDMAEAAARLHDVWGALGVMGQQGRAAQYLEEWVIQAAAAGDAGEDLEQALVRVFGRQVDVSRGFVHLNGVVIGSIEIIEEMAEQQREMNRVLEASAEAAAWDQAHLARRNETAAEGTEINEGLEESLEAVTEALGAEAEALAKAQSAWANYFGQALEAAEETTNWTRTLLDSAIAAGVQGDALIELARATGDFTDEQIEAAIKTATMQMAVEQATEAIAAGEVTVREAIDALRNFEDQLDRGYAVELDLAGMAAAQRELDKIQAMIAAVTGEHRIHFDVTQSGGGGSGEGGPTEEMYQRGGFTGWGSPADIAGAVHRREFVFSAPAVAAIGVPALERMHEAARGGGLADMGQSIHIAVDARGASDPAAVEAAGRRGALLALEEAGVKANARIRMA